MKIVTTNMAQKTLNTPPYSKPYSRYVLLMLTGVATFSFADRQLLIVLQESIKNELLLNDTQLGLLTGFAFAVFYVTLGLPIAKLADRSNRRNIISISLTIWSGMTALSGFVANYWQLLLARIGVGIGEAGGTPPAVAMISDYFPKHKRATALSMHSTGIYIGIIVGFLIGGIIDQYYGWRVAFFCMGIPGLIYALIFQFTVKEPQRGLQDQSGANSDDQVSGRNVLKYLLQKKTFIYLAFAAGFHSFVGYGTSSFFAPYLIRVHGLSTLEAGVGLALVIGLAGGIGTFLGGFLTDRLSKRNLAWYLWLPAIGNIISFPFALYTYFSTNPIAALAVYIIPNITFALYIGPSLAVLHGLVPANMRAFSSAIYYFILNFIGLGFGPLVVGMVSDWLQPQYGVDSLRWAMSSSLLVGFLAAIFFYQASKTIKEDLEF